MALGLLGFLKRKLRRTEKRPTRRMTPVVGSRPKNGRLVLGLVGAIALMIVLGLLNVRLIRDPSIAGKFFGSSASSRNAAPDGVQAQGEPGVSEAAVCPAPPEVTFYRKLKAQEDKNGWHDVARGGADTDAEMDVPPEEQPKASAPQNKVAEHIATQDAKKRVPAAPVPSAQVSLPKPQDGTKTYMVQVGAFAHPNVAQQWAGKWKSRGYDVVLKPAARPKTGVIYRLYLGSFSSEAEADKLVKRLKAKEGITAFRLTVRNGN